MTEKQFRVSDIILLTEPNVICDGDIFLNQKEACNLLNKLSEENEELKSDLDKKLDFIVNLLFDVYCHCDVHYNELLGSTLARAESVGFNVEPSKDWDYDESSYEFWKKELDK